MIGASMTEVLVDETKKCNNVLKYLWRAGLYELIYFTLHVQLT